MAGQYSCELVEGAQRCTLSAIIGHGKGNAGGVASGFIWVSAATTKMKTTRSCIMIGAPNVVAKFNAEGVFSILI